MELSEPSGAFLLDLAVRAAQAGAAMIRAEAARPGGPRGSGSKADVDTEVEEVVCGILLEGTPGFGFEGEETGERAAAAGESRRWIVDPNDGTRDFLLGLPGSSVSIALVAGAELLVGVVLSPLCRGVLGFRLEPDGRGGTVLAGTPDPRGDLIAWARDAGPIRRNGEPLPERRWARALAPETRALVATRALPRLARNERALAPARPILVPSIAYRLALAAAGDAEVALTLGFSLHSWDFAGAHALLRAAGGRLVDASGANVPWREGAPAPHDGRAYFGGSPHLVEEVARRYRAELGW